MSRNHENLRNGERRGERDTRPPPSTAHHLIDGDTRKYRDPAVEISPTPAIQPERQCVVELVARRQEPVPWNICAAPALPQRPDRRQAAKLIALVKHVGARRARYWLPPSRRRRRRRRLLSHAHLRLLPGLLPKRILVRVAKQRCRHGRCPFHATPPPPFCRYLRRRKHGRHSPPVLAAYTPVEKGRSGHSPCQCRRAAHTLPPI